MARRKGDREGQMADGVARAHASGTLLSASLQFLGVFKCVWPDAKGQNGEGERKKAARAGG